MHKKADSTSKATKNEKRLVIVANNLSPLQANL